MLTAVVYHLFDFESDVLTRAGSAAQHRIDRELRLDFSNGTSQYFSWASEPAQYCVGVQSKSFFLPGEAVAIDATTHPLWRPLVQKAVELVWLDSEHQVLELRGPEGSLYLASVEAGEWQSDTLTVAGTKPT